MSVLAILVADRTGIPIVKIKGDLLEHRDARRIRIVKQAALALVLEELLFLLVRPIRPFRRCNIEAQHLRRAQYAKRRPARCPRRVKNREVLEDRDFAELIPASLPFWSRRKRFTVPLDRVDKDFVAFWSSVVRRLLDPRSDPLPFLELLVVADQAKRDRKKPNEASILFHPGDARRLRVLAARRGVRLTKNQDARLPGSHRPIAPVICGG